MGYSKFEKLREIFVVLFQKLQGPKSLLDFVSMRIFEALVYETSGFSVSFAAAANWLAASPCSLLATVEFGAFKALRAWPCA